MNLRGVKIGVTGAGSGIGLAIVRNVAAKGATVWVTDRDEGRVDAVVSELKAAGHDVHGAVLDVVDEASWHALLDRANGFDWFVNNAGISVLGPFLQTPTEQLLAQISINLNGVILGTKLVGETLPRGGRLINISSVFGVVSLVDNAVYCASKHGVRALSECLVEEWKPRGVKVHCVHPGAVNTNIMNDGFFTKGGVPRKFAKKAIQKGISPEEAAKIILRGIERERFRIIVGKDAKWLVRLARLFPERHRYWLSKNFRR